MDELEGFCPKAPLQSPLLWGEWDVVYAARPGTIAGPFKSPVGRVVFPGLESSQARGGARKAAALPSCWGACVQGGSLLACRTASCSCSDLLAGQALDRCTGLC